jgi:hypothetical protein
MIVFLEKHPKMERLIYPESWAKAIIIVTAQPTVGTVGEIVDEVDTHKKFGYN